MPQRAGEARPRSALLSAKVDYTDGHGLQPYFQKSLISAEGMAIPGLSVGRMWAVTVAQRAVQPDGVVTLSPLFDQHLCLLQDIEDLAIGQLVPELCS